MKNTEIVFLIDRSGSMAGLERDTIGGYNSFIKEQKKLEGNVSLSTVLFDNNYEVLHDRIDIEKVKPLTEKEYFVRGTTSLFDAIGITINNISKSARKNKVIFVITTDGMENSSKEYTKEKINKLIKSKKDWEFLFLGANIDAYEEGTSLGIKKSHISNYKADSKTTNVMYECLAKTVSSLANDEELKEDWNADIENE
jgi:Uncharacterized protein encoded in toxicity protection region of plasmid R478, contains von Willebrand factor (vWF) domain